MTRDEVIDLLSLAAGYDRRKAGHTDIDAWHLAVGDLRLDDARLAVVGHYRETTDWLMPAHVRQRVKAIRSARLQESPMEGTPPPDAAGYAAWYAAERKRIADGTPSPRALDGSRD